MDDYVNETVDIATVVEASGKFFNRRIKFGLMLSIDRRE